MRHLNALVGTILLLFVSAAARADIPPLPPPGLRGARIDEVKAPPPDYAGPRPLAVVVAGVAGSLAIVLGGIGLARYRGGSGIRFGSLAGAAAVLVTAGVIAVRANREVHEQKAVKAEYDRLKAEYDRTLAEWRPGGGYQRWLRSFFLHEMPPAVAVFALASHDSFPQNLPWAALMFHTRPTQSRSWPTP